MIQATLTRAGQQVGVWAHGLDTIDVGTAGCVTASDMAKTFEVRGKQIGLQIVLSSLRDPAEIREIIRSGMTTILVEPNRCLLFTRYSRSNFAAVLFQDQLVQNVNINSKELAQLLAQPEIAVLAVKPLQDCDLISSNPVFSQAGHPHAGLHQAEADTHGHLNPLSRFFGLLRMERVDVGLVGLFAFCSSLLSLATPLAVESLVNVISWGVYIQPLIVLALALLFGLILSGLFSVLQNVVVEILQRRQFVRIVCDLAHRFPMCDRQQIREEHPRELANRVLDIMTIQKATAVLLLDGTSIVVVSVVVMLLLGIYYGYLLGFEILMIVFTTLITWVLGHGGVATALEDSKVE